MESTGEKLRELHRKSKRAREAKLKYAKLRAEEKALMKELHASGYSLQMIADSCGVTKARVWQIVREYNK